MGSIHTRKAYDTVTHEAMLAKLEGYGVKG